MTTIFHITARAHWETAASVASYRHPSLDDEGFIHLSTPHQVVATTARYYDGVLDLVLLQVDTTQLADTRLVWEPSSTGEIFPHLYGALERSAVTNVHEWGAEDQALFDAGAWPATEPSADS